MSVDMGNSIVHCWSWSQVDGLWITDGKSLIIYCEPDSRRFCCVFHFLFLKSCHQCRLWTLQCRFSLEQAIPPHLTLMECGEFGFNNFNLILRFLHIFKNNCMYVLICPHLRFSLIWKPNWKTSIFIVLGQRSSQGHEIYLRGCDSDPESEEFWDKTCSFLPFGGFWIAGGFASTTKNAQNPFAN